MTSSSSLKDEILKEEMLGVGAGCVGTGRVASRRGFEVIDDPVWEKRWMAGSYHHEQMWEEENLLVNPVPS